MVELYQLKWLRSSLTDITTDKDFTEKKNLVQSSKHFLSCNNLMTSVAKISTTSSGH